MAARTQVRQKPAVKKVEEKTEDPKVTEKGEKLLKDLDAVIDEIDDVLYENAETFCSQYIQKGGQVTCHLEEECPTLLVHEQKLSRLW